MKYIKEWHKRSCIIINSFLFYYYGKIEIISNYKCTFGLKEGESTSVTQKQMSSPCPQYGGTVHLFIGTGHNPYKITFMSFTLDNNSIIICRGLNSLFIFKSVSPFCCHAEAPLHIASWSFHPSSWSSSVSVKLRLDRASVYPQPDSEDTCSHT